VTELKKVNTEKDMFVCRESKLVWINDGLNKSFGNWERMGTFY
jgi:hypothetical protein